MTSKLSNTAKMDALINKSPTFSSSVMETTLRVDLPQAKIQSKRKNKGAKLFDSILDSKQRKVVREKLNFESIEQQKGEMNEKAEKILMNKDKPRNYEFEEKQ